jgi:hypothetical protein
VNEAVKQRECRCVDRHCEARREESRNIEPVRDEVVHRLRIAARQSEKQDQLRQQRGGGHHGEERQPAREDVVGAGHRTHAIQVQHAVPTIGTEQFRSHDGREHEHDDRRDAVEIRVRRKIESCRGAGTDHAISGAGDQRHHERDRRQTLMKNHGRIFARAPRPSPSAALTPSL